MSGRITDVAVVESKPSTMYVASASGGLWKTVNNGITWTPVFDREATVSLGDVTVAPSNPDVVWIGTGEANARNSVSWGDGVYKSADAGKTWKNMGLRDTRHIGRIIIHPKNPDIVYVAALGHIWGPNQERGVFKTSDGGKTWQHVLFINEHTGCIDLALDANEPATLYAAAYQVRRDSFSGGNPAVMFGPGSGLYRTEDGGKTWVRMTNGLPDRPLGRCGFDIYRKDPRIVYAVIQTDKTDLRETRGQHPKTGNRAETGGIFRSEDKGKTWTKVNDLCPRPFYYGQIRVDPNDDKRVYVLGVSFFVSSDGGKTFRNDGARGQHADYHALWINPRDSDHLVLGGDAGVYFSYDRTANWEHLLNLPVSQFYEVGVDMRRPYRVYGGLQDNGSWGGPSATRNPEGITITDWSQVMAFDGFYCQIDPTDADIGYAEGKYGNLRRFNLPTGTRREIRPRLADGKPPARTEGNIRPPAADGAPALRYNWNSPLLLSPHNPRTLYYGGNHLFRSVDRGDHWEIVSPDLTRGKPGPSRSTGHTITTIAESPLKPGLIYVGTDDGRIHVSRNGGAQWTEVSEHVPGVGPNRWINRLECSHFAEGTAYLAIDRHRNDDLFPYLFVTTDYGATWYSISSNLPPDGPLHVVRQDLRNKDLLFAGTEFGLFVSLDGGNQWHRLGNGLPTVAVHDLAIHPRDRELVIGTHGRGIYIMDIAPLEELTQKVLAADCQLFEVRPALEFRLQGPRSLRGGKLFTAANPPYGAMVYYYFKTAPSEPVHIAISDPFGNAITEFKAAKEAGLHRIRWDLQQSAGPGARAARRPVRPGDYVVRLKVGDRVMARQVRVEVTE